MTEGIVSVSDKILRACIERMADKILCFLSIHVASGLVKKHHFPDSYLDKTPRSQ